MQAEARYIPAYSLAMGAVAPFIRLLEETADHFADRLPAMLTASGLVQVSETGYCATLLGPLSRYSAIKSP